MRIGYSFWGFLGAGITDTPDGGRSHRRTLIDGIITDLGHEVVFLQANRDLDEADEDLRDHYTWDSGFPNVDALMLEWRWPIEGRNTTTCGSPGHTCDLHRQAELLAHYTRDRHIPTLIWDKDLQLATDASLRHAPHVTVCEAGPPRRSWRLDRLVLGCREGTLPGPVERFLVFLRRYVPAVRM
ncbi:hypothetical protein [Actinomadura keratinilytica]|uniref:hypothetical protein n=1 Tax=Actinomadura keratinilytica TaxID=547461 RepID=UPI00360AA9DA